MKNILIADSGSTKTEWWYAGTIKRTQGLNPFFVSSEDIAQILESELLLDSIPDEIYFYGAGATSEKSPVISEALQRVFPKATISVHSDMLGAARALCGDSPGIACILGTGANSCYYDGKEIQDNVSPLGFIIGDEGSGAVLGKLFLGALLKNQFPKGLKEEFLNQHNITPAEIIDRIYRQPLPNRYLASFSPFIAEHLDLKEIRSMVVGAFRLFIVRNIKQYPQHTSSPVHFVGSIAKYYEKPLREACDQEGIVLGNILKAPIEKLAEYHKLKQ